MPSKKNIKNMAEQVAIARRRGASKVILDIELANQVLSECVEMTEFLPIIDRLENLAFDTDDLEILMFMVELSNDLKKNATYINEADVNLFEDFTAVIERIYNADIAAETDENSYYSKIYTDYYEGDNPSSFRKTSENSNIASEAFTSSRDSWLSKILDKD